MKKNITQKTLSLSILALSMQAMTGSALAQTAVVELDEVVVSGSRSTTKLSETPVSIGAVKSSQWEQDKPKSVGEIINRIAGVQWNDLGNEQHSMAIRQPIGTNAMYQYLEDGIPIRPLGVFNHNALNETNMNGSDGVEVVKGAASSLFGSNAVGGAVNFLTKKPSATPTGMVGVRMDNVDKFKRIDTGASNTWGDLGLRFSHYSSERDSKSWQNYSGGKKDSFTLRADYDLSATSWLRASVVQTDLDTETPGSLGETDYRTNPSKSINTFTWRKDKTTRANVAWEGETTAKGVTTATVFFRNNDHGQLPNYTIQTCTVGLTCPTGVKGTINNNHVQSMGLDVKHDQKLGWLDAKWVSGVYIDRSQNDYVSDNLSVTRNAEGVNVSYVQNNAANPALVRNYGAGIANDALFSQLEFTPVKDWRLVAGGRFDSISYDFKNNLAPGANFGAPNETRSFSKLSLKLGSTWALSPSQSLYANVSQGFTPPEVSQLYGKSAIPSLNAAVYLNREIGWRAMYANNLRVDSAYYQLDGTDTIVSYTISPGNSENRNAGKTRSEGLELSLSQEFTAWDWQVGANMSRHAYVNYKTSATVDYSGNAMAAAPWHTINATLGYRIVPNARIAVNLVKQGEYYMDDANTGVYAGHTLLNLTGSYQMGDGWESWFQVRNLTDQLYANTASRSGTTNTYGVGAPRSLMLGITKLFGKK